MGVARLDDSEGVHLNQVGGVRHHDVGLPIHTSPAVAVKAGRLIVAKALPEAPQCSAPLSCPISRQRDRSERA